MRRSAAAYHRALPLCSGACGCTRNRCTSAVKRPRRRHPRAHRASGSSRASALEKSRCRQPRFNPRSGRGRRNGAPRRPRRPAARSGQGSGWPRKERRTGRGSLEERRSASGYGVRPGAIPAQVGPARRRRRPGRGWGHRRLQPPQWPAGTHSTGASMGNPCLQVPRAAQVGVGVAALGVAAAAACRDTPPGSHVPHCPRPVSSEVGTWAVDIFMGGVPVARAPCTDAYLSRG